MRRSVSGAAGGGNVRDGWMGPEGSVDVVVGLHFWQRGSGGYLVLVELTTWLEKFWVLAAD